MQQSDAAKSAAGLARALELGNGNGVRFADNDNARPALAVDEQADLPADSIAQGRELARLFERIAALAGVAALVKLCQALELAGLEALCISLDLADGVVLLAWYQCVLRPR